MNKHIRRTSFGAVFMVFTFLFAPVAVYAQSGGVVLWNKLGSDTEVTTSVIGAGFGIHSDSQGGVQYVPGQFGTALATTGGNTGGGGYLTMSPGQFFPADKTRGTVGIWIQKKMVKFVPYVDGLLGIFGSQPYDWQGGESSYESISALWSDGETTYFPQDWSQNGIEFAILDSSKKPHAVRVPHWENVPVGQWVHLAFVWDLSGISGTPDKLRIYKDGILEGSNVDTIIGIFPSTNPVKVSGNHAYSRVGHPMAYFDNIVVYDYAKTDFSDRFNENPVGQTFSTFTPSASITLGPKSQDDSFKVSAKFDLGTENNGIDPVSEDVSITFGNFSTMIPAGEFQQQGLGLFTFKGTINEVDLSAHIHMPQSNSPMGYLFSLDATGADLDGTVLPPEVKLTIGDDTGQAKLNGGKAQFGEGIGVPGDVNGDGEVNCNDLKIVKLSFGKKASQARFDPSADLNNDGIVDVKELAIVSRQLPSGTVCK